MRFVPNTSSTAQFYNNLVSGAKSRNWLGMSNRYQLSTGIQEYLVKRHFDEEVSPYISPESEVLDFGCGPGIFTERLFGMSSNVTGVDISEEFIRLAKTRLGEDKDFLVVNANLTQLQGRLFDVVVMIDVIHHLENPRETLERVTQTLKPGGLFLIFEPNLLSWPILLMHIIDPNERGLLNLGRKNKYLRIFREIAALEIFSYNGIVIGPANIFFCKVSDMINSKYGKHLLKRNNPKIFMVFKKIDLA